MKQLKFKYGPSYKKSFGGELLLGKRKSVRPLANTKPIHLVIRSSQSKVFIPWNRSLEKLIYKLADKFNIKIYDLSLNWSHIHSLIMIKDRKDYLGFIRALTSIVAQRIRAKLGAQTKVFPLRPFTRILEWGRDFENVLNYVLLNQLESVGLIRRQKQIHDANFKRGSRPTLRRKRR